MPGVLREIVLGAVLLTGIVPPFNALLASTSRNSDADIAKLRADLLTAMK